MYRRTLALIALAAVPMATLAQTTPAVVSYVKQGKFEEVRDDLKVAIESKGLVIDYHSKIGNMLDRTGADVGSAKKLYVGNEAFVFCSAKLSRAMMEADLANAAQCPYSITVYATTAKPSEVVVTYRPMRANSPNKASQDALAQVNKLIDSIAREAAGKK